MGIINEQKADSILLFKVLHELYLMWMKILQGKGIHCTCLLYTSDVNVRLNEELGKEYYAALTKLGETLGISSDVTALQIGRFPEDVYKRQE